MYSIAYTLFLLYTQEKRHKVPRKGRMRWGEKVITINSICIYVYTPPFCVYTRRRITTNIPPHTHPFNSLNKLIKKGGGGRERWSQ